MAAAAQFTAEFGIEPEYIDIWGNRHAPSEEAIRLILCAKPATTESLLALDPTLVVREDAESIPLRMPADRSGSSIKLEIRWEDGDLEHHWFWLPELPTVGNEKRACRCPNLAARLSRNPSLLGEPAGAGRASRGPLHRMSPARAVAPRAHGGRGAEPLRLALRAQLGLRRCHRSARRHRRLRPRRSARSSR